MKIQESLYTNIIRVRKNKDIPDILDVELGHMNDLKNFNEPTAHILSIHLTPKLMNDFEEEGFMLGIKLSFNKRFPGITRSYELFQSLDKNQKGCLKENGE